MLDWIRKREEIAASVFKSVAERDQFLPAINSDEPTVLQIPAEFFRLDAKIDNVGISPDKRMKWLDVGNGRIIFFPPVHAHGAGFAQFDSHNPWPRVRTEKQGVFLKF